MTKLAGFSGHALESGYAAAARFVAGEGVEVKFDAKGTPYADLQKRVLHLRRLPNLPTAEDHMLGLTTSWHEALHPKYISDRELAKSGQTLDSFLGNLKGMTKALHTIWNAIEDNWIETVGADRTGLAGLPKLFGKSTEYFNRRISGQVIRGETPGPLWEALCAMDFAERGYAPLWALTPVAKRYFDAAYAKFSEVNTCSTPDARLRLAKEIYDLLLKERKEMEKEANSDKQDGEQGEEGEEGEKSEGEDKKGEKSEGEKSEGKKGEKSEKSESGEEEGECPSAAGDLDDESEKSGKSEGEGEESEEGEGEEKEGKAKSSKPSSKSKPAQSKDGEAHEKAEQILEDEARRSEGWDKQEILSKDVEEAIEKLDPESREYCADTSNDVFETIQKTRIDDASYNAQLRMVGAKVVTLGNVLEQALRSWSQNRVVRNRERGVLDTRNLVRAAKGLSKRVFTQMERGEALDTVVTFIIDESGSMTPEPTRLLAMIVGEVLARFGVPFEVIGATTVNGRVRLTKGFTRENPIRYRIYKTVGDNWQNVKGRMVHTSAIAHNVDGEVVEYVATRIAGRRESRKIVFSFSDGLPMAGHGNDDVMQQHLKAVCSKVRKAGIEVYAFGIGTEEPKEYYGEKNFIYLQSPESMGDKFFRRFAEIITKGRLKV